MALLPTIDVSSPAAATKSLREFDRWCAADGSKHPGVRLAIDNMRMDGAHKSEAMKQKSREVIDEFNAAHAVCGR